MPRWDPAAEGGERGLTEMGLESEREPRASPCPGLSVSQLGDSGDKQPRVLGHPALPGEPSRA